MLLAAAHTLADQVSDLDLAAGRVYRSLTDIRKVSALIAPQVADTAWRDNLASVEKPENMLEWIYQQMFDPVYRLDA